MKMKKIMAAIVTMALTISIVGCGSKTEVEEIKPLTVGVMGTVGTVPIIIAKEKGYFDEAGVDVNVETFKSASDLNVAVQAGQLDGILNDTISITILQNSGIDLKITGITDATFKLVAGKNSGITSLEDIKGKKIGISENTVMDFTLDQILAKASMNATDVEKVSIPSMPTRLEMLSVGKIDVALMPDPFASSAVLDGGNNLYEVTAGKDTMLGITAFSKQTIDNNPDAIKAFYKGYNKAVEYINSTDISEYEDIVMTTVGYPETMRGNITLPVYRENKLPETKEIQTVIDWSKERGLLTRDLKVEDITSNIGVK